MHHPNGITLSTIGGLTSSLPLANQFAFPSLIRWCDNIEKVTVGKFCCSWNKSSSPLKKDRGPTKKFFD
jgi:hypothetical protein